MLTKKGMTLTTVLFLVLGVGAYVFAQQMRGGPGPGRHMMEQGQTQPRTEQEAEEWWEHMGPWMGPGMMGWGMMGPGGHGMGPWGMGPGMMMGGPGMMGFGRGGFMGPGMGMMGGMMRSPELMGTMMAIHGDTMSLMGRMVEKYGSTTGPLTAEAQSQMRRDLMENMGDILIKHGTALKNRAKE